MLIMVDLQIQLVPRDFIVVFSFLGFDDYSEKPIFASPLETLKWE